MHAHLRCGQSCVVSIEHSGLEADRMQPKYYLLSSIRFLYDHCYS